MRTFEPAKLGALLRTRRRRLSLSQPAAAARAGVSTRLWSEVERGERPNVSFATVTRMLEQVGVALAPRDMHRESGNRRDRRASTADFARDLRRAEEFGIDISLLRDSLDRSPLDRIRTNAAALDFFASVTLTRGGLPGVREPELGPPKGGPANLIEMMERLAAAGVRVAIVGGMAACLHGSARLTTDLDVCYETSARNIERLVKTLREWDAYPRDLVPGRPFTLDAEWLRDLPVFRLTTRLGRIDLMHEVPGVGRFRDVVSRADTIAFASGRSLPVIGLEKLIRAKETAGRSTDREALLELRALRALRRLRELGEDSH